MSTQKTRTAQTIREGVLTGTVLIPVGTAFPAKIDNVTVKREVTKEDDTVQTLLLKAEAWLAFVAEDAPAEEKTKAVTDSIDKAFDLMDVIEAAGGRVTEAGMSESGLTEKYRFHLDFDDEHAVTVRLPMPNRDTGEVNPDYSSKWSSNVDPEDDSLIRIGEMTDETDDDGNPIITTKPFRLTSVGEWAVVTSLDSDAIKDRRARAKARVQNAEPEETVKAPTMSDPDPLSKPSKKG